MSPLEHSALTCVEQTLPSKMLAPGRARFRISTPAVAGWPTETSTGGLLLTRLPATTLPSAPATIVMPLALPTTVLPTMTLSLVPEAMRPIPKLLPWTEKPFAMSRFARSRLPRVAAASHMPPQGNVTFPFREKVLLTIS